MQDDQGSNALHLDVWILHRGIQEIVPLLRDTQVRLPGLAIDVLLNEAAKSTWKEILWRLSPAAKVLEKGLKLVEAQAAGDGESTLERTANDAQERSTKPRDTNTVDRLIRLIEIVSDQLRSGAVTPELMASFGDTLKVAAVMCWELGPEDTKRHAQREKRNTLRG